jgi:hypothetical protein
MSIQITVNTPHTFPIVSNNGQLVSEFGVTYSINDMIFFHNENFLDHSYLAFKLDHETINFYSVTLTPGVTGVWRIFVGPNLIHTFEVVDSLDSKDYLATLTREIHNESIGSWQWDKVTGELTLFAANGEEFKKYTIIDTAAESSRELIQEN